MGPLTYTPDDWWVDAQRAIKATQQRYARVAVFGLSMGGNFALRALETLPGVIGGGAFATPLTNGSPHFRHTVRRYMEYITRNSDQTADFDAAIPAIDQQKARLRAFARGTMIGAKRVQGPVLLAQGGSDEVIDPHNGFKSLQLFWHAPASLLWYPAGHHILTADPAVRKQLSRDVVNFLQRLDGAV